MPAKKNIYKFNNQSLNNEHFRLLIESTRDYAIFFLDPDGLVKTWNIGAQRIIGYPEEEIIGKHFSIFYTQEAKDNKHPDHELELALAQGRYQEEGWRVKKNGAKYWSWVTITPIYDNTGKHIGFGKVTQDLSEKKKLEQLKNEFISVVSHELRTPLTSIKGALSLLLSGAVGALPNRAARMLSIANVNCERLSRLIVDILDFERLEENKVPFNSKIHDIGKLIKDAIKLNQMYADKYTVKLVFTHCIANVYVNVDSDRLLQVLSNLISNAVKFSPKDSEVELSMEKHNKHVRILVTDHGPGIPDEFRSRIFQRFSQIDTSSKRQEGGTGLGLAISKAIIEHLEGSIDYKSKIGEGCTFYFDLPIAQKRKAKN